MGPASPNWKTGKRSLYARHLPARLQADFQEALDAPDPLDFTQELAYIRSLVSSHVAAIMPDEATIEALQELLGDTRRAVIDGKVDEAIASLDRAVDRLALAERSEESETRAQRGIEQLRRLGETMARVQDMRANSFTRAQALALNARLVELIAANIRDPQDRMRLLTALTQLGAETAPAHQLPAIERKKLQ